MRVTALRLVTLALFVSATAANAAGINDAIEASQEGLAHRSERQGIKRYISLSFSESFMGPGVNNLDGHLTSYSSAPNPADTQSGLHQGGGHSGHGGHGGKHQRDQGGSGGMSTASAGSGSIKDPNFEPGASLRHVATLGVHINDAYTIGPVVEMSEKLYGPTSGTLKVNDPQLRFTIANLINDHIGPHVFTASMWFSASAPVSDQSRAANTVTALGVSFLPRLRFAHSDFSLSGMASAKPTWVHGDYDESLFPTRMFGGIQGNYRISRPLAVYVMNYISGTVGPQIATPDSDLTADSTRSTGTGRKIGLMPGLMIRATDFLSISPRLNWNYGQPIQTTTVGVNANLIMI